MNSKLEEGCIVHNIFKEENSMKKKSAVTVTAILIASLGLQNPVYASNILDSGYEENEMDFQEESSEPVVEEETEIAVDEIKKIAADEICLESSGTVNNFGDRQHAEELRDGQVYDGCTTEEAPVHWYKFVPELTREYTFDFSFNEDLTLYCDIYTEEDGDLDSIELWEDDSYFSLDIDTGKVYYFGIKLYDDWEETIVPGSFTLEVTREMGVEDDIQNQIKKYGPLKQLEESDNLGEKAYTKLYVDVEEDEDYYVQFVPKYTRHYQFESDQFAYPASIWDYNFNPIDDTSNLEEGKTYYICVAYGMEEAYDLDFSVVCVPQTISFKILESPNPNIIYRGCDSGPLYFPRGIVFEIGYENGMKEIRTPGENLYDYQMIRTSFGEHISNAIEGVKLKDYDTIKAGTYSMTFKLIPSGLEARLDNIILKEMNELPLIKNNGSLSVLTNFEGHAWLRFKAEKTGKYTISGSCGSTMSLYVYEEGKTDERGFPKNCLFDGSSGEQVSLEGGKYYYVEFAPNTINGIRQDEVTITIKPEKSELSKCKLSISSSVAYTGKTVVPTIKITDGKVTLKKNSDYTVTYSNNKNFGTATAVIKGAGRYTGTIKKTFKIVPATPKLQSVTSAGYDRLKISWNKVTGATAYQVLMKTSKGWKVIATTKSTSYIHVSSKTYPVLTGTKNTYAVRAYGLSGKTKVYSDYNKTGISGQASLSKPAISTITKATNGLKLQWKKISGASGYVVQRYDKGKWVTKKTIKSGGTVNYTDTTAKKSVTYKYRIKAYRVVNKKNVYSAYSSTKAAKR